MKNEKHYVIDTNVLFDGPSALFKLRNGNENSVYIPYHVLLELNKFKKDPRLGHIVAKIVQTLYDHPQQFKILTTDNVAKSFSNIVDNYILDEIHKSEIKDPILITNDRILQLQADLKGIRSGDETAQAASSQQDIHGSDWVVKKFKGSPIYAHLVLKGDKSRGPITDLVINSGL